MKQLKFLFALSLLFVSAVVFGQNKITLRVPSGPDTTSLSNRIDLKLNISDTAAMNQNFVRRVYRKVATDSVFIETATGQTFAFKDSAGGGGVTIMGAIGSSPNANGATITGNTLVLQPADASFGGVVTTGTQTFAGAKTFSTLPVKINASDNVLQLRLNDSAGLKPAGIATKYNGTVNAMTFSVSSAASGISYTGFAWGKGDPANLGLTNTFMYLSEQEGLKVPQGIGLSTRFLGGSSAAQQIILSDSAGVKPSGIFHKYNGTVNAMTFYVSEAVSSNIYTGFRFMQGPWNNGDGNPGFGTEFAVIAKDKISLNSPVNTFTLYTNSKVYSKDNGSAKRLGFADASINGNRYQNNYFLPDTTYSNFIWWNGGEDPGAGNPYVTSGYLMRIGRWGQATPILESAVPFRLSDFNGSIAASAILDIATTAKGVLLPRMTSTQRDAIGSPATGLEVYNTTSNTKDYYTGTAWTSLVNTTDAQSVGGIKTFTSTIRTLKYNSTSNDSGIAIQMQPFIGIAYGNNYGAGNAYNKLDFFVQGQPKIRFFDTLWSGPSYDDSRAFVLFKGRTFGGLGEGEARFKVKMWADGGLAATGPIWLPSGYGVFANTMSFHRNGTATNAGVATKFTNACDCLANVDFYGNAPKWRFNDTNRPDTLDSFSDASSLFIVNSGYNYAKGVYVPSGGLFSGRVPDANFTLLVNDFKSTDTLKTNLRLTGYNQMRTKQSMLKFFRPNAGSYYTGVVDFVMSAYGTASTTGGESRLDIRMKDAGIDNTDTGSMKDVITFRADQKIGVADTLPSSTLSVKGSFSSAVRSITTGRTLDVTDYAILADATSGAFNVTLPTAVGITGRIYVIKKTDSSGNAVTVNTTSSQTIDGSTTYSLASQYKYVTVQSDGANWQVIGNN